MKYSNIYIVKVIMFKSQSYTSLSDNNSMASAYSAEFFTERFKAFSITLRGAQEELDSFVGCISFLAVSSSSLKVMCLMELI